MYELYEYEAVNAKNYADDVGVLDKALHSQYLLPMFLSLPKGYESLDAGIPWIPYWLTNALEVCGNRTEDQTGEVKEAILKYLKNLVHPEGGFRGNMGL